MDVTDEDSVATSIAGIASPTAVVDCAGLSMPGPITEPAPAHWQTTVTCASPAASW